MKNFLVVTAGFLSFVSLVSCMNDLKKDSERVPASAPVNYGEVSNYVANNAFAGAAYDRDPVTKELTHRHFSPGTTLTQDQEIKELAGREIWFKSAPNDRFHSYYFPQKVNSPIAWYKILRGDRREKRFNSYGLINDPDCCTPGKDCDSRGMKYHGNSVSMNDTFGWDYCLNDEALLDSLKDPKGARWQDPACNNPVVKAADDMDGAPRESRCELAFGNPTGAVGYRKYPNPRFNAERWKKIGGWAGFEKRMSESEIDSSIEAPFRVGKACASCHAAFDPLNPPKNMIHPQWSEIKGETGNQYLNIAAILGSGVKHNAIEYQMFVHARPGLADTSAVPNDYINNPGTINAIINFPERPKFTDNVARWESVNSCSEGKDCQVTTYKTGQKKYWKFVKGPKEVMHILKGGEDSVGADLAVQRVYVNIGMCAEQCWGNHLANNRELDPTQRGYGQSPFNIAQCRADCPSWRANEDRVGDILSYLLSRRPTDLKDAVPAVKAKPAPFRDSELEGFLDTRYGGSGLATAGKEVFAKNCAQCHSSQNSNKNDMSPPDSFVGIDFKSKSILDGGEEIRLDWMGNDKSTRIDEVGTYKCRSLHTNHMKGHVWEQFASETYKSRAPVIASTRGKWADGGRGYMRNISLLNVWAHAPFMHNNSVGPEICGNEPDRNYNDWRNTVEGQQVNPQTKYSCSMYFNPSVESRLKLFEASVDELLTPSAQRVKKIARTDEPIKLPLGFNVGFLTGAAPMTLSFPAGFPVNSMTSLDYKGLTADLAQSVPLYETWLAAGASRDPAPQAAAKAKFDQYWAERVGSASAGSEMSTTVLGTFETLRQTGLKNTEATMRAWLESTNADQKRRFDIYLKYYSNCDANYENLGHDFGTGLGADEKKALKAFLATL
jgi:hypothetical protein